ncbi:MAG TPA: hypothetical protein VF772_10535 [Terriglobales bacterium]
MAQTEGELNLRAHGVSFREFTTMFADLLPGSTLMADFVDRVSKPTVFQQWERAN